MPCSEPQQCLCRTHVRLQHHSSRDPGGRGNHSWASQRGDRPGPAECTPEHNSSYHLLDISNNLSDLLDSEPGLGGLGALHNLIAGLPLVCLGGLLVVFVGLTHHQDVVTAAERIRVDLT